MSRKPACRLLRISGVAILAAVLVGGRSRPETLYKATELGSGNISFSRPSMIGAGTVRAWRTSIKRRTAT